jgi:hydrogenase maturation protease
MTDTPSVLILGIGNLLWSDEGFGVRAAEQLYRRFELPANVRCIDGGTQGIYLVDHVRAADILIVFDAVDYGLPGGTIKVVEGDDVPSFMGAKKMSLHQTGFQEVLAMAALMGDAPAELLLIGVQPVMLEDFGGGLTPPVAAQIDAAVAVAVAYLAERDIRLLPRTEALPEEGGPGCKVMTPSRYEGERPSEAEACRVGDARVLVRLATGGR